MITALVNVLNVMGLSLTPPNNNEDAPAQAFCETLKIITPSINLRSGMKRSYPKANLCVPPFCIFPRRITLKKLAIAPTVL